MRADCLTQVDAPDRFAIVKLAEPAKAEFLAGDHAKARLSRYVIRRFGKPDDVAYMVLFLCSNAASWITGQTYPVNGGYSFAQ